MRAEGLRKKILKTENAKLRERLGLTAKELYKKIETENNR